MSNKDDFPFTPGVHDYHIAFAIADYAAHETKGGAGLSLVQEQWDEAWALRAGQKLPYEPDDGASSSRGPVLGGSLRMRSPGSLSQEAIATEWLRGLDDWPFTEPKVKLRTQE